jgi:hypothetical protein
VGCCEHGDEPLSFVRTRKSLSRCNSSVLKYSKLLIILCRKPAEMRSQKFEKTEPNSGTNSAMTVRPFVFQNLHYAIKTCGGVEAKLHGFLTSTLDGGKWSGEGCPHPFDLEVVGPG